MRDLAHYQGREQEFIKHTILEEYLPELGYRVGRHLDDLVYVDGFAGPWLSKHETYEDASFGVAAKELANTQKGLSETWHRKVSCHCIFVEKDAEAFVRLNSFAEQLHSPPSFNAKALRGAFVSKVPDIIVALKRLSKSFKFIFLDPKGWADIPMLAIRDLLTLPNSEVLITLMTSHMARFLEEESRAESYAALFGRPGVLEIIRGAGPSAEVRVESSVREYCKGLRDLCGFTFVSEAVILEPAEEKIRYFLIYATNHPKGISVFKGAERKASILQTAIRNRKSIDGAQSEQLSLGPLKSRKESELERRYTYLALAKVLRELIRCGRERQPVAYRQLFCEAMAFPYVIPDDLQEWLEKLERIDEMIGIRYDGTAQRRRKLSPDKDDSVMVFRPDAMKACLAELDGRIRSGQFFSSGLNLAGGEDLDAPGRGEEKQSDFDL